MTPAPSDSLTFEHALSELERILRNLEDGSTTLEQSLTHYERGVALLKGCYQQLRDAEQRILRVTGVDADGKPVLKPFEHSATLEASPAPDANLGGPRSGSKNSDSSY